MKKTLALGTLILCCCLVAVAQTGSTPNQTPPASTPSTFPQDQTGQNPANPDPPSGPSAIPPDTSAEGQEQSSGTDANQASNSHPATVEGCLSQSSDGDFMLAGNAGIRYHLHGESGQLSSYLGNQIQVDGTTAGINVNDSAAGDSAANSASSAGSMASSTESGGASNGTTSSTGTTTQINVVSVHKLADTCAAANPSK
jgi:hypothetical protein